MNESYILRPGQQCVERSRPYVTGVVVSAGWNGSEYLGCNARMTAKDGSTFMRHYSPGELMHIAGENKLASPVQNGSISGGVKKGGEVIVTKGCPACNK